MAKHSKTNGDPALQEAKERRAKEIESLRASDPMFAEIVPETWVARELGFPPYLVVKPGVMFRGTLCERDDTDEYEDPDTGEVRPFVRWHVRLIAPVQLECKRGPNDERGESIVVQAGQIFTMSDYRQLSREFLSLLGLDIALVCRKETKFKDRRNGEPRVRYDFDCFTSPEDDRMLMEESEENRLKLREAYKRARLAAAQNRFLIPLEESRAKAAPIAAE